MEGLYIFFGFPSHVWQQKEDFLGYRGKWNLYSIVDQILAAVEGGTTGTGEENLQKTTIAIKGQPKDDSRDNQKDSQKMTTLAIKG